MRGWERGWLVVPAHVDEEPMDKRRRDSRISSSLGPIPEFILRAWAILRAGRHARIAWVLVAGGVAVVTKSWIEPVINTVLTLWFEEPIAFPAVPLWYGPVFILLGLGFAIWSARQDQRSTVNRLGPGRSAILDRVAGESVARCTARLTASVASQERVANLVGSFDGLPDLAPAARIPAAGRVTFLLGPLGSGKSFIAERLFRDAVNRARDAEAPIPVYLSARHVQADLRVHVAETASQLGNPTVVGAAVVVDQLDDVPADARRLHEEASAIANSWPNTGVLLVARSVPWLRPADNAVVQIREMTWGETEALMNMVSGSIPPLWNLPETVQRSARRPWIAILLADYIASRQTDMPVSVGRLVDWMVRRAIERVGPEVSESVEALLRALAVRLTDGRVTVSVSDLSSAVSAEEHLLATRLVSVTAEGADFALPVVRQWFAYAALRRGEVSIDGVVGDPTQLDRWVDVLATAVELAENRVDEILEAVARSSPAVAALIIDQAIADQRGSGTEVTLTAEQFGLELRRAMSALVAGLGPLGDVVGPVDQRGRVRPLGVRITDEWYVSAWYEGTATMADVVDLAAYPEELDGHWLGQRSRNRQLPRGWAWLEVKEALSDNLRRRMETCGLPVNNAVWVHEVACMLAMDVLGRGSPFQGTVSVDELEHILSGDRALPARAWRRIGPEALALVFAFLRRMVGEDTPLCAPWPGPDLEVPEGQGGFAVWDVYSAERVQERLTGVLDAALGICGDLVSTWFPRMGAKCDVFCRMPVRLTAYLDADGPENGPRYSYYFDALGDGQSSYVEVHLESLDHDELIERAGRGSVGRAVTTYSSVVDVFGHRPASGIALKWLSMELSELGWLSTIVLPD